MQLTEKTGSNALGDFPRGAKRLPGCKTPRMRRRKLFVAESRLADKRLVPNDASAGCILSA
jgi:hypothetical protein